MLLLTLIDMIDSIAKWDFMLSKKISEKKCDLSKYEFEPGKTDYPGLLDLDRWKIKKKIRQ